MVYYIAKVKGLCCHIPGTFTEFIQWVQEQKMVQFDIETNISERWYGYKLISMQFGSCSKDIQWFLQWSELDDAQRAEVRKVLESTRIQKLAHNAVFEYVVCRFHGIICENFYDTMLAEKVIMGGQENENYSLADLSWKYLRVGMDKTLQSSFGDNIITEEKIDYGITDVKYLQRIRLQQMEKATVLNLLNVIGLENESMPAFGDITYEGMRLDIDKWRANITLAEPVVTEAKKRLDAWLSTPEIYDYAYKAGFISNVDRIELNFKSPAIRTELLKLVFPGIPGSSLPIVKKFIRDNGQLTEEQLAILVGVQNKDYAALQQATITAHRDYLISKAYIIPAGTSTINWNSNLQVLSLLQSTIIPKISDLSADTVAKYTHPILTDLTDYKDALKLVTTYGETFIQKYVDEDGKVRTTFNQVVSTGRVSSSNPNMQNIPAKETVGTRYRNAFVCEPGEVFVDSDFSSQELCLIAHLSKDPVWIDALNTGKDLHSVCSELVYEKAWKDAAEATCEYYYAYTDAQGNYYPALSKHKCSCKRHKVLRTGVKTIDFGLAYGMSEIKLSGTLKITYKEANALINKFFTAFPGIKRTLDFMGKFGVENGYIITPAPFFRRRIFPYWKSLRNYIDAHIMGVRYNGSLGEIERASKNHPVQGGSADMTKLALVLIRTYIRDNKLRNKIRLVAQVHDQVTTIAVEDIAETWKVKLTELMEIAAKTVIPSGLLKAETNITKNWTK